MKGIGSGILDLSKKLCGSLTLIDKYDSNSSNRHHCYLDQGVKVYLDPGLKENLDQGVNVYLDPGLKVNLDQRVNVYFDPGLICSKPGSKSLVYLDPSL